MKEIEKIKEELERIAQEVDKKRIDYIRAEEAYESCLEKALNTLNGRISREIKDTEIYKRCKELMNRVWKLVKKISYYKYEAIKLFGYFKPFSYKRRVIPLGGGYLIVGNLIYETFWSDQRRYPTLEEVFRTFVRYGDEVVPYVRRTIREELAEFHTLAKSLTAELYFDENIVTREGEFRVLILNPHVKYKGSLISYEAFDKISIRVDLTYPPGTFRIILFNDGNIRSVEDIGTVLVNSLRFLELYDVLADMCDEAYQKLQAKKERCEEIVRKMREIAAPFVLSEL
ncbi:MAG: hypothetical protein J7J01_01330 [Methanophagales archaeon]|nr:hypothetical protein [Methanophagales archaeon]